MEKYLWKNTYNDMSILIDKEECKERALVSDQTLIIENIYTTVEDLQKCLDEEEERIEKDYEMRNFLAEIGFENADVYQADEYPERDERIAFDCYQQQFFRLDSAEIIKIYEWWDGNNFITIPLDKNTTETHLVLYDHYVELDEYDGKNYVTGGIGKHEWVYKILEIDGKDVQGEDLFLLHKWSECLGVHETGEIMDIDELREHLKNLNRDVAKYMFEIGKLSGK